VDEVMDSGQPMLVHDAETKRMPNMCGNVKGRMQMKCGMASWGTSMIR